MGGFGIGRLLLGWVCCLFGGEQVWGFGGFALVGLV